MKKTILFFASIFLIFAFFSPEEAFAQSISSDSSELAARKLPPKRPSPDRPMNFNGRRMPRRDGNFTAIGVKVDETGDFLTISIFFNDALDSNSVEAHNIFINETQLPPKTEFLFNKNRHMLRFTAPKSDGTFTLKLVGLRSYDGKIMNPTEIKNLEANSFCKYSREARTWQKSSL